MRYFTTALLLFVSLIIFPKERYYFSNLSLKDGLSQITVTTIHQDKKGYMWFGTRNGLNRYDGYQFEAFVNNSENTSSISDNHILCIAEDNKNCLWIGTNNGLNKLDLTTDKIKRYLLPNNMVSSLYFDTDENLWIGTNSKLYLYKPSKDSFTQININGLQTNNTINAIVRKNEELYVGTSAQGVIVYNIKNNEYYIIKHEPANLGSIAHNNIRAILIDKNDNLWIGTHYGGVSLRKKGHNNFTTYNKGNGLTNDYVRAITEAPDGNIVVGTFNGLNTINPQTNEIVQYKTYDSDHGNLSHYSIYSTFFDRAKTLWVGTYAGGVSYFNPYGNKFRYYDPSSNQKAVMGIIGPIVEYGENIYIATEGGGLLEMNKQNETFKHYKLLQDSEGAYAHNILKSIYLDGGKILCGTNVGTIYSFDIASKRFSLFHDFQKENAIYHISRNANGDLLVGGVNEIGFTLITKSGEIKNRFQLKDKKDFELHNVRSILEISKEHYLIGTRNDGLYSLDLNKNEYTQYRKRQIGQTETSLPENYVTSIFKDSMGQIWVGTFGGGFSLFNLDLGTFKTYTTKHGLLDNNICTIVEDNDHHLWISSTKGISDFNIDAQIITNYTHSNGLNISEFTPHSGVKLSNNQILFSGNNGFIAFDPQKMSFNPYVPPVVLSNLYVNNKLVVADGTNSILNKRLDEQKEILLQYNESNFAIEYSALNYVFTNRNQYKYKLEGFDKDWNDVGSRRIAYYTNVPPGKYKFIVKGSNNDEIWNNEGTCIIITINPPFWRTWWAYCIYTLSIVGLAIFIFRYYSERKRLENNIKLKQAEAKAQDEFHEARNKLFTNFSHELRTPLTLILSPLEDMVENAMDLPSKIKSNHQLMYSNSLRMLRIINNLMDFQKKESGTMKLKVSKNDFIQFTDEMIFNFKELAVVRNINIFFHHDTNFIESWFDQNFMEKVYFNLLSNAFKNVPNGGMVQVNLCKQTLSELRATMPDRVKNFDNSDISYVVVEIKDSGVGIAEDELENIFTPFYQVAQNEHSSSGTGLGLSLSKSIIEMHHGVVWAESPDNSGAVFKFILPLSKQSFKPNELIEENLEQQNNDLYKKIESVEKPSIEKAQRKKVHTIMVVEDNVDVRNYIQSHLSPSYNILQAGNGAEAIDIAINNLPDLIISDLMMPKMDGMQMTEKLKKDLRTSHIPIILVTAKTMLNDIKDGYEIGADDYITKPFNSSLLIARVDNIIQSREKLKEIYSKRFSLETLGVETTAVDERFMQKLYQAMENNLSNPELNLESFSKEIGMSKANLYRKIKSLTNLSPNEFIRNFRLEMGAKMLKGAKMPVSEVYVAVGFSSHAYFSNCFKTLYGISPSEYTNKLET